MIVKVCFLLMSLALMRLDGFEFKISYVHDLIVNKNWTCYDVVGVFLKRSYVYGPKLNAIVNFNSRALADALELDEYRAKYGRLKGKLHCVPVAIKDIVDVAGIATTGGILALRNSVPRKDAPVVEVLRAHGAIFVHKTNLGELANGFGPSETGSMCRNPFNVSLSCGGSSSGSGAAIATGMAIVSIGTDTTGSILIPSCFNGIFGLRPPHGQVDMRGIFPFLDRLDTAGPMAKHLEDVVLTYSLITNDPSDMYEEFSRPIDDAHSLKLGYSRILIDDFTVQVPRSDQLISHFINPYVKDSVQGALKRFESLGIQMVDVNLNYSQITDILADLQNISTQLYMCIYGCKKHLINAYLSGFESDAPHTSFSSLFKSPLLSDKWKVDFDTADMMGMDDESCGKNCAPFESYMKSFKSVFDQWLDSANLDAFLIPTRLDLPYLKYDGRNFSRVDSFDMQFCSFTSYACLNVPVDYAKVDSSDPDGLPVGVILVARPNSLNQMLKIAKLYENAYSLVKLPYTTPLLNASSCLSTFKSNYLALIFLIFIKFIF